ncbi:hypothetical protein [Agromyces archimandritae]|uniref:Uncharacterized protein n=1 Tax=Agromyces archimandritae TaxID=2781962 RepID=A0A975IPW1_9MICO|nr:hypothetical protein [Agromyces archimandritae]QTX06022.1 hypothetical protein G127AT_07530 [Agromyces archimandritae]
MPRSSTVRRRSNCDRRDDFLVAERPAVDVFGEQSPRRVVALAARTAVRELLADVAVELVRDLFHRRTIELPGGAPVLLGPRPHGGAQPFGPAHERDLHIVRERFAELGVPSISPWVLFPVSQDTHDGHRQRCDP